jgi:hypothetical protein
MSQVFYQDIGRTMVVPHAAVIVVVKKIGTEQRTKKSEGIPDFSYTVDLYTVIEVLRGELNPGDMIDVEDANASSQFSMHDAYHRLGMMGSPIYQRFTPQHPTGDQYILYLNKGSFARYAEYCIGSKEPLTELDEVKELVAKSPSVGSSKLGAPE